MYDYNVTYNHKYTYIYNYMYTTFTCWPQALPGASA